MKLDIKGERQEREVPGCNNGIGGFHEKFPPPPPLLQPKKFKGETGKRNWKEKMKFDQDRRQLSKKSNNVQVRHHCSWP